MPAKKVKKPKGTTTVGSWDQPGVTADGFWRTPRDTAENGFVDQHANSDKTCARRSHGQVHS
jgi:hypothetical protein